MESRGDPQTVSDSRLRIHRRSCDQCRSRKIGCDRASPCSNCISARLNCTHSTIAPRAALKPKPSISAEYEQKLDNVARDIDDIKDLLQKIQLPKDKPIALPPKCRSANNHQVPGNISLQDYSAHVIDFVKTVADGAPNEDLNETTASLKRLVRAMETPESSDPPQQTTFQGTMPPLDHVVNIIRWAKGHRTHSRVVWICRILPLEMYENICRRVFFATDDYTDLDLIISNSFLSYMFAEYAVIYHDNRSQGFCEVCRSNVNDLLYRLPLTTPASLEAIAALVFGALYFIEQSEATRSWTLISFALSHCQTLGYHRTSNTLDHQQRLFWTVFSYESTLSLRLGRQSGICDFDITVSADIDEPRFIKVSRIQRKVYQHLYSAVNINSQAEIRTRWASVLSEELRQLIDETRLEVDEAEGADPGHEPLRTIYLRADMVCYSSLLVLILRAFPSMSYTTTDDCVMAARNTIKLHQECMDCVRECKNPSIVSKYIAWAILHTPFVPFTVLYERAIKFFDHEELRRLNTFAASLEPPSVTNTHSRLYTLLCEAAVIYNNSYSEADTLRQSHSLEPVGEALPEESFDAELFGASDWYYGNQFMNVLDENLRF